MSKLSGYLSSGRGWEVVESRKSALPPGRGKHYILHFVGDPPTEEVSMEERQEAIGLALQLAETLASKIAPGRFRVEVNGPGTSSRPYFHVHIICVDAELQVRSSTATITAE